MDNLSNEKRGSGDRKSIIPTPFEIPMHIRTVIVWNIRLKE